MYSDHHTFSPQKNQSQFSEQESFDNPHQEPLGEGSYYVVVPSNVLEDKRLGAEEIVTFLHISNFLKKDGYASCSDKWLSEKRGLEERQIRRHLEKLEKYGYIYRHTEKIGMYWKRRIWLPPAYEKFLANSGEKDEKFKKCFRTVINDRIERSKMTGSSGHKCPHNNISIKQEKKTTTPAEPAMSSSSSFSPDSLFNPRKKYLKNISEAELLKLKTYYEKYRTSIQTPEAWITECVKNGWHNEIAVSDRDLQENFRFAKALEQKFITAGWNNNYTFFEALTQKAILVKGGTEIPLPSYNMNHERFKEFIVNALEKQGYKLDEK